MTQPAPPPIIEENPLWLITDISHELYEDKKVITVITDIPCQLTMLWSAVGPIKELRLTASRGIASSRDAHYSFHEWGFLYQDQDFAVKTHTFTIPKNGYPNKMWFQFQTYYYPGYCCPVCDSTDITFTKSTIYWCNICRIEITPNGFVKCPNHFKQDYTTVYKYGARCNTCGFAGEAKLFRPKKPRVSCSPFFFQAWFWPPSFELLYHEPWTYELMDLELLFHEPWSPPTIDLEKLFHEPWSSDLLDLELLFHEPWSPPTINLIKLFHEPWSDLE